VKLVLLGEAAVGKLDTVILVDALFYANRQ
jgi:hypothetical protein